MNDLVVLVGGVLMVDSALVAKKFSKEHRGVMRALKNLECRKDFWMRNFAQSEF